MPKGQSVLQRFIQKINKTTSCWFWTGNKINGYGRLVIYRNSKPTYHIASRVAWTLFRGPIPEGFFVCHKCDTPACVNPDHLFLGKAADNHLDMHQKGRGFIPEPPRGETHPKAILKDKDIKKVQELYATGQYSHEQLGKMFGVSRYPIYQAVKNYGRFKHKKHKI